MIKLKFKSDFLKSSNKFIFYKFFKLGQLLPKIKKAFQVFRFLKHKEFFRDFRFLGRFRFLKYNNFFWCRFFFLVFDPGLKSTGFHFRKYKKSFLLKKYNKFFNIRARKFHLLKYKKRFLGWIFLLFFELGLKSGTCCPII